jgi:hypothetical protein
MALQQQNTTDIVPAYVSILLAMTYAKQGYTEKAREMLGIVSQQAEASKDQSGFELQHQSFAIKLLINEAKTLLGSSAQQPQ